MNNFPVSRTTDPPVPAGACAVAAFSDSTTSGTNLLISYPTSAAAAAVAAASPPAAPQEFAVGIYVVQLDPALLTKSALYRSSLAVFVGQTKATT